MQQKHQQQLASRWRQGAFCMPYSVCHILYPYFVCHILYAIFCMPALQGLAGGG